MEQGNLNDDIRRPFSPPFKQSAFEERQNMPDRKPMGLRLQDQVYPKIQVTKNEILRDSLEEAPPGVFGQDTPSPPAKAVAENEHGEMINVVFDPVMKCYYDPSSNVYYDLA
jgi:hypothetical protein